VKDEPDKPRSGPEPASEPVRRANPDTEQLAAQMSALLAELVRTPEADLGDGWTPAIRAATLLPGLTTLMATVRPRAGSSASQTTPMPPRPSSRPRT
jgi:hypothetical protein